MPVRWPFRKVMWGMTVALVGFVGYGLVALLLGAQVYDTPILVALIFGGTLVIALPIFLLVGSMEMRVMRRMVAGDYLVRWTYTQMQWELFTEQSWARSQKTDGWSVGALAVLFFIAILVTGTAEFFVVGIVAVGLVALLLFGGDYWLYRQRQRQGAGEVLIGRAGILRPEGFTPLLGLDSVKLESSGQRLIRFTVRYRTYQNGMSYRRYRTYEVPVPQGHEAEAERLVKQLQP